MPGCCCGAGGGGLLLLHVPWLLPGRRGHAPRPAAAPGPLTRTPSRARCASLQPARPPAAGGQDGAGGGHQRCDLRGDRRRPRPLAAARHRHRQRQEDAAAVRGAGACCCSALWCWVHPLTIHPRSEPAAWATAWPRATLGLAPSAPQMQRQQAANPTRARAPAPTHPPTHAPQVEARRALRAQRLSPVCQDGGGAGRRGGVAPGRRRHGAGAGGGGGGEPGRGAAGAVRGPAGGCLQSGLRRRSSWCMPRCAALWQPTPARQNLRAPPAQRPPDPRLGWAQKAGRARGSQSRRRSRRSDSGDEDDGEDEGEDGAGEALSALTAAQVRRTKGLACSCTQAAGQAGCLGWRLAAAAARPRPSAALPPAHP